MRSDIIGLYNVLKDIVKNDFDLLIVLEKKTFPEISFDYDNLFVRYVDFYTPVDRVTSKPYDNKSYNRLFSEFVSRSNCRKQKKFKFETPD